MPKPAVKSGSKTKSVKAGVAAPQANIEMQSVPQMDRQERIAFEAYLRAEARGFQGGDPVTDWLEAEEYVDRAQPLH